MRRCSSCARIEKGGEGRPEKTKPAERRVCRKLEKAELLQLHFLVSDVLTSLRVVLVELQFFRRRTLVLGGGIEVSGTSCGFQLDFFATAFSHFTYPSLIRLRRGRADRPA